jgi:hypothetical protein
MKQLIERYAPNCVMPADAHDSARRCALQANQVFGAVG